MAKKDIVEEAITVTIDELEQVRRKLGGAPPAVTHEFFAELKRLQSAADGSRANWERAKDKASTLKKVYEEDLESLLDFIRRSDGTLPMFEGEKDERAAKDDD